MAERKRLICASEDLVEGGRGVRFEIERQGITHPCFLVRHQGRVRGFINRCGHAPVELDWQEGEFFDDSGLYLICANHGALYSPETGRCLLGRCRGRGLQPVPVSEVDGRIYLTDS